MDLQDERAKGSHIVVICTRHAKPAILTFALMVSALISFAPPPSFAYSEASSEAGTEAGRESGGIGYGRRGRWRNYYRQQQMQQQRQQMQQQKRQMRQQQMQARQARTQQQSAPHLQIKNYATHGSRTTQQQQPAQTTP